MIASQAVGPLVMPPMAVFVWALYAAYLAATGFLASLGEIGTDKARKVLG
jgi:hypothetical protein